MFQLTGWFPVWHGFTQQLVFLVLYIYLINWLVKIVAWNGMRRKKAGKLKLKTYFKYNLFQWECHTLCNMPIHLAQKLKQSHWLLVFLILLIHLPSPFGLLYFLFISVSQWGGTGLYSFRTIFVHSHQPVNFPFWR